MHGKKRSYRHEWWKIITIYSKEIKTTTRRVEDTKKEDIEECRLLGGDFNGRIGEREAKNREEDRGDWKRKSKDKVENAEEKRENGRGTRSTEADSWKRKEDTEGDVERRRSRREREEKEIKKIRTETEVWKYISSLFISRIFT
jgi:hypothetical protein